MDKDKEILLKFLEGTQGFIGIIVSDIHLLAPDQEEIYGLVRKSWEKVGSTLDNVKSNIYKGNRDSRRLTLVGLTGVQLELKYKVYKKEKDIFDREWQKIKGISEPERKAWWLKIKGGLLQRLINVIDIILDSISSVIPPAHAIKEFKDVLLSIISK